MHWKQKSVPTSSCQKQGKSIRKGVDQIQNFILFMKASQVAFGAFLLTLGVTLIAAIPEMILVYGVDVRNANVASMLALFEVIVASIDAGILLKGWELNSATL